MPFCWISTQREVSVCPGFGSIVALLPCRSLRVSPFHLTKPHRNTVNLSLHSFSPEHFSPFRYSLLFGSARKNSPVSSPFAMFSGSYPWIMDGNLATHSSKVSLFTSLDSPQNSLNTI